VIALRIVDQKEASRNVALPDAAAVRLDTLGNLVESPIDLRPTQPPDPERREALLAHRDTLAGDAAKSIESYERALLTLSSAVLGPALDQEVRLLSFSQN
jgi:hypothetical protein